MKDLSKLLWFALFIAITTGLFWTRSATAVDSVFDGISVLELSIHAPFSRLDRSSEGHGSVEGRIELQDLDECNYNHTGRFAFVDDGRVLPERARMDGARAVGEQYSGVAVVPVGDPGDFAAGEILDLLRGLHLGPLPRWVEIKVRAWAQYYGKAAVQTITLVQIKDNETLQELLSEPDNRHPMRLNQLR